VVYTRGIRYVNQTAIRELTGGSVLQGLARKGKVTRFDICLNTGLFVECREGFFISLRTIPHPFDIIKKWREKVYPVEAETNKEMGSKKILMNPS